MRKLFGKLGVAYESVDLDSVAYQRQDLGGKIRAVLKASDRVADDSADLHRRPAHRRLHRPVRRDAQRRTAASGSTLPALRYDRSVDLDPYELLPKWVHPRKAA